MTSEFKKGLPEPFGKLISNPLLQYTVKVPAIPAEDFVGSVAGESHCNMLSGHARKIQRGDGRSVAERLIVVRNQFSEDFFYRRGDHFLVMFGLVARHH